MTALHDAMGRMITDAGAKLAALPEDQRPGTVIVAIMTDGLENASQEWHAPAIKALVEQQTTTYGWEFLYMGADQDAVEVGVGARHPGRPVGDLLPRQVPRGDGHVRAARSASCARTSSPNPAAPMPAFTEEERRRLAE